jgi:hypothetical protein
VRLVTLPCPWVPARCRLIRSNCRILIGQLCSCQ